MGMSINQFIYQRQELNKEIGELGALKNLVFNNHCYPLGIMTAYGAGWKPLADYGYTMSRETREAIEKEIQAQITKLEAELSVLESRVRIS